jgi:hypothetical protein
VRSGNGTWYGYAGSHSSAAMLADHDKLDARAVQAMVRSTYAGF